jgi:hypothetical protein
METCSTWTKAKSLKFERAMWAILFTGILTLLQTKHRKEQLFNIFVALMGEYCKHFAQNMFKVLSLL